MTSPQPENFFQFEKLLVAIARAGVDFAVVGGVAVSLNGFVRATDDVDILIDETASNVSKLLTCLTNWGEGFARELKPEDFVAQEGSIRVTEEFDLDIFTRMLGHSFAEFQPRLKKLEIGGVNIPYLAPEDLILLKGASWREKDQIDVAALKRIIQGQK
jgi:predicted nucleotidyltransferase